jgi:hypothetical protein
MEEGIIVPPAADVVARRAIILSVVSCRGITDEAACDPEASKLAGNSAKWLCTLGLDEHLSEWERKILATPFGALDERTRINASWLSEAIVVLSWALGCAELPAFDAQCDPAAVANALGFLQAAENTALSNAVLRTTEELKDYNEFVYSLHWRLRDFSLHNNSFDFEQWHPNEAGRYGLKLKEKDLCVAGGPLSLAKEGDWRRILSITQERHRASNWLIGYGSEDFYEVSTDT